MYTRFVNFNVNSNSSKPVNRKKSNPSFSGHILTKDSHGNNIYKFFLPNAPKGTKVVLTRLESNENDEYTSSAPLIDGKRKFKTTEKELTGDNIPSYTLYADDLNLDHNAVIGYKFKIPERNKYVFDNTSKAFINGLNDEEGTFTIATPLWTANSVKPRVIEHLIPDSFNVTEPVKAKKNHFNRLGGTIKSINNKISDLKNTGVTSVLGTPLFGMDHSAHGYWTINPYQITDELGDILDFKKLMIDMYKKDMRWIADGAFVNEGIPGMHISDIVYWGAESPSVDMFETKDLKNLPTRFGVLSKNPAIEKHIHLKLVNAPYKIIFEKTPEGNYIEKKIIDNKVDPTKPTFVQLFDDRLASEDQMNNDKVFSVYAKKETDNNFEIAGYRDSVQPYYHRVTLREVEDNYKKYKEAHKIDSSVEFKNLLTKWRNFEFVESNKDGGISLWVGNSDISKKRFITPEKALEERLTKDKYKQKMAAQYQVQDDTVQVGKFWTSEVARTLVEYTARTIENKRYEKEDKVLSYQEAVKALIDEGSLPASAKAILEKDSDNLSALDNILTTNAWGDGREYKLTKTKMPESVTDGLMSYPFEATEFAVDLLGVFTYPYIKNMAVTEDTVGMSRYDFYKMGDEYYDMMPDRYRDLYKKSDKLIANDMTQQADNILSKLSEKLGINIISKNGELTEQGKDIYSVIYPDIAKFLLVSSLAPKIKPVYKDGDKNNNIFSYNISDLRKVNFNSLNLQYELSPEDVASRLLEEIKHGLNNIPDDDIDAFVNHLSSRLKDVNSDSINVAKLIIEQTESGLDWRIDASKDVGDFESVEDGLLDYNTNIKHITSFWNKFNKGVREYNPRSYTIGELTDWSEDESKFAPQTNFSTVSDYKYFYSFLPKLYAKNSDGASGGDYRDEMYTKIDDFLNSGYASNVNFAHRFVGNHDKPRMMHVFALDASGFVEENADKKPELMEQNMLEAMKQSSVFKSLNEDNQNALIGALHTLRSGKVVKNGASYTFDKENFGVRPFDFNIDSVIEQASLENKNFGLFAKNNENKMTLDKLKAEILNNMLYNKAMRPFTAMWFAMNALPGAPTMYAGDELAMTGWETFAKNEKQENRNRLPWEILNNNNYKFIKDFNDNINKITKIRSKEAASALVNGTTILLTAPTNNSVAFYRYNDKTDAICVIHNNKSEMQTNRIDLGGLPAGLKVGTIYRDALDENVRFKVTNPYEIKRIDNNGNIQETISLRDSGLILLREKDFSGKELSFKGRIENPNVKLVNTKYNFSYMTK